MGKLFRNVVPSLCSLANLGCGFGVAIAVINNRFDLAPWLILLAMIFDAYDGRLARLLHSTSKIGGELDSFCDVTTFGIAPALLVGALLNDKYPIFGWTLGFLFISATVYRLARFNVMQEEGDTTYHSFAGLPSTGAGGMIAALVVLHGYLGAHGGSRVILEILPAVTIILSLLMVTRLRFANTMGFVSPRFDSPLYAGLLVVAVIIFAMMPYVLPTVLFAGYILLSLLAIVLDMLHLRPVHR